MVLSTKVEPEDLLEAERLARYVWAVPLRIIGEHHLWAFGMAAVVLTGLNLFGRERVPTRELVIVNAVFAGVLLMRWAWISMRRTQKARKMNRNAIPVELRSTGLYLFMPDGKQRVMPWNRIIDTRVGRRVLLLYYKDSKRHYRSKRYLIVPIHQLNVGQKNEILLTIPEHQRGSSVQRQLKQWRIP